MNRSSSTPPSSRQSSAYCAPPGAILSMSLVSSALQERQRARARGSRSRPCARRRTARRRCAPRRAPGAPPRTGPASPSPRTGTSFAPAATWRVVEGRALQVTSRGCHRAVRLAAWAESYLTKRRRRSRSRSAGRATPPAGLEAGSCGVRARVVLQELRDVDLVVADLELAADAVVHRARRGERGARARGRAAASRRRSRSRSPSRGPRRCMRVVDHGAEDDVGVLVGGRVTISAASLTSNRPRSWPPVMFSRMPVAPSTDSSSSGEEIAFLAASAARFSPPARADAHQRRAGVAHDRAHVGEVEVDQAGHRDQVGDALHALAQDVVGLAEGVEDGGAALDHRQQPLVRDHDQRVDLLAQRADALLGLLGAPWSPRTRTAA